jgi:hypothetical protein
MARPKADLSVVAAVTVTFFVLPAQAQTTWYVDDDNCPGPGSGTLGDPFCLIQDGIDAAVTGDTVLVADGNYSERVKIWEETVTLASENGPEVTTIDATEAGDDPENYNSVVTLLLTSSIVKGFTITGGKGLELAGWGGGGVIGYQSSPTICNNVVRDNIVRSLQTWPLHVVTK